MVFILIVIMLALGITGTAFVKMRVFRKKIVKIFKNDKTRKEISLLYGNREAIREEEKYIEKKIKTVLLMLFLGSILAVACIINEKLNPVLQEGYTIKRPSYEKGIDEVSLYATGGPIEKEKISVKVSDRVYTDETIQLMAEEVMKKIYVEMLMTNPSADHVSENMNLMNSIEGYPFLISWKSEKPIILSRTGELNKTKLKEKLSESGEESCVIKLQAILKYEKFYMETEIPVCVVMPEESAENQFLERVENTITDNDLRDREEETLILPNMVDGESMHYEEETSATAYMIVLLSVIAAIGLYFGQDNDLTKKTLARNEQMEGDYPGIVNRYALYYCAGMHPKAVWREMCRDYRLRISKGRERRYAYEAMLKTEAMMNDGRGDTDSLNEFALECKLKKYSKFVNLIEQALIKGKEEMGAALREEAEDAINERLIRAKIKGEEAGTKLLLPMFMMLSVVLVIVIVPAFINFKM